MNWTAVTDWLLDDGIRIGIILVIGLILWLIVRKVLPSLIRRTLIHSMEEESEEAIKKRADTLISIFLTASKIIIAIVVIFMILSQVGVEIGPILAGFGIAGVAVGFGAQYLIRDLIAGVFILIENQYRIGDVVRVSDTAGFVEAITMRKTVLRDLDGILHHVPNGEVKVASNFTRKWARAHLNISVAYKEDLDRVMAVLKEIWEELAQDPKWGALMISKTPSFLRVDEFGDSGITIKLAGETLPIKQWDVMGELRRRIKRIFDEEGIEIPWPHTKIYFGSSPEEVPSGVS